VWPILVYFVSAVSTIGGARKISLTHLHADHFAADDDLHAPVLLPPGDGIVVGDRVSLAKPFGRDGVCR
jgi:hypothetical protein